MRIAYSSAVLLLVAGGCATAPHRTEEPAPRARVNDASQWRALPFPGKAATRYTFLSEDGRAVIHAQSDSSASMLRRTLKVDAEELRAVKFSWRVPELIEAADLSDRYAEDSPVRLILAFDGDHSRLSMRNRMLFDLAQAVSGEVPPYATLMYVWDNKAPTESVIQSGRTDRIRKIVLESGASGLGVWRHYERDIVADFRKSFGEDPGPLIAVALMTDSDNTRSRARAWYGEVRLVGPDGRLH
jgi:Protein of unknown function (DUF3047)